MHKFGVTLLVVICFAFCSCDKGYQIRFRNYYTEPIDSVVIGNNNIVFTAIETQAASEFKKIDRGQYNVSIVSKTKKRFNFSMFISGKGEGNKTIQIDAIRQIAVLDE